MFGWLKRPEKSFVQIEVNNKGDIVITSTLKKNMTEEEVAMFTELILLINSGEILPAFANSIKNTKTQEGNVISTLLEAFISHKDDSHPMMEPSDVFAKRSNNE